MSGLLELTLASANSAVRSYFESAFWLFHPRRHSAENVNDGLDLRRNEGQSTVIRANGNNLTRRSKGIETRARTSSAVQQGLDRQLPIYSLRVAAGKFLENQTVTEEGWVDAPEDLKVTSDMFVAAVAGHSMEPSIPNGSLCVFRARMVGSPEGRLVLVEARGPNDGYTIKRYRGKKISRPDGSWSHEQVRLEPLNPEFESWDLDPQEDRYRIVAEFLRILKIQ